MLQNCRSFSLPLLAVILLLPAAAVFAQAAGVTDLEEARAALRARAYDQAITAADRAVASSEEPDHALYLKALAQYHLDQHDAAVQAADQLMRDHPDSRWYRKARFLKAHAYTARRDFQPAEIIYEEEAYRLLDSSRKEGIAGVLVDFAEALATEPGPSAVGAPAADYQRAYNLLNQALAMELGRSLRDKVMFTLGHVSRLMGNHGQAVAHFHQYLDAFDPDWTGPVGSIERMRGRVRPNPPARGERVVEARYELGKAQLALGQYPIARRNFEDLLALIRDVDGLAPLAADTAWQIVRSYNMPECTGDVDRAIKESRDFLAAHPNHLHSIEAAWLIPRSLQHHGRYDEAVAAYREFMAGDLFDAPAGDDRDAPLHRLNRTASELEELWTQVALHQIGAMQAAQHKYADAMDTWQGYINRYPNGPDWANAQRGIIDAKFSMAIDSVAARNDAEAFERLGAFLTDHPLDDRAPQAMFIIGQIHAAQAAEADDPDNATNARQRAISEWAKLISKYPNTEQSSLALYRTGVIYEEELGNLPKALESYRALTWGTWAQHARTRISIMTEKHLKLRTERAFRSNEAPAVTLDVRNVKELKVRQYFLDPEAYFRKTHALGGVEQLDIALIEPDKTWNIEIDGYEKYRPLTQQIEIPFDADAGVCVIHVTDDDLEATTLVLRSDLDVIVRSSLREMLVFAQDMVEEGAQGDVRLLISDGKEVFMEGSTGDDGVFRHAFEKDSSCQSLRVFAIADGHVAATSVDLSGARVAEGLSHKGYLYTDRPTYQPGQTVSARGIVRNVGDGSYAVPAGDRYLVSVTDPQGRVLVSEDVVLSDFGTFATDFQVYADAAVGEYTLMARSLERGGGTYSATFQVQQFQLEKIAVDIDTDRDFYFRGELVTATISAEYYWGQPATGKSIRYRLPDGREFVEKTDDSGTLSITWDSTGATPGTVLYLVAQIDGETAAATHAIPIPAFGFSLSLDTPGETILAGSQFDAEITATAPGGSPVSTDVRVIVEQAVAPAPNAVLSEVPWIARELETPEPTKIAEYAVTTNDEGVARLPLTLEAGGEYTIRAQGTDRFDRTVATSEAVNVSGDQDAVRLRLLAETDSLNVGRDAAVNLHSRINRGLALITIEGDSIIDYRIATVAEGMNTVDLAIGHEHFPNFAVTASVMESGVLHQASRSFEVNRRLSVTIDAGAELSPGTAHDVGIRVTDQNGDPVSAELSLALVNEALFAQFPDGTPAIENFFQTGARRFADFRAAATNGFNYDAKTMRVVQVVVEEMGRRANAAREVQELAEIRDQLRVLEDASLRAPTNGKSVRLGGGRMPESETRGRRGLMDRAGGEADDGVSFARAKAMPDADFYDHFHEAESAAGLLLQQSAAPRKDAPQQGWWTASIVTDDNGRATVKVPFPDIMTRWRLTARGATKDTLVGEATANTQTREAFFVEIRSPRIITEGDQVRVLATVHNLNDAEGEVNLQLLVASGELQLASLRTVARLNGAVPVEVLFDPVEVPNVGELDFTVVAQAGDLSDALLRTVRVMPWGLPYASHGGGVADGSVTLKLELPRDIPYTSRWMTIAVSPDLRREVIDMALSARPLIEPQRRDRGAETAKYPSPPIWGSSFAGSELLASVEALEYARTANATATEQNRLVARARALLGLVVMSQNDDGGWNWMVRDQSDWAVTSTTFWAICRARDLGVVVPDDTINKGQTYLLNAFRSTATADQLRKAIILHALSTNDAAEFQLANMIYRERNGLEPLALSYTALALANLDYTDYASEVLDVLIARVKKSAGGRPLAHWTNEKRQYSWIEDDQHVTAMSALALIEIRPQSELIPQAVEYLLNSGGCFGRPGGFAFGPTVDALAAYFGEAKFADNDFDLTISVNGREMRAIARDGESPRGALAVPAELLQPGENTIQFAMRGRGAFAYAATLYGFSQRMQDPRTLSGPSVRSRRYYHDPLTYEGASIGVNSTSPVQNIEIGQRVRVAVDLANYSTDSYCVVEETLPAGMTLVPGSLSGNFAHHEFRDGRLRMFTQPGHSVSDFSYELVGYSTGTYRVLPTVIRDVLDPSRMRIGSATTLRVLPTGELSDDPYQMNDAERFALGRLYFDDGRYNEALGFLEPLFDRERPYQQRDVARMLLWISTDEDHFNADRIVRTFEVLSVQYPDLTIPFDKILTVGRAYRMLGEFERAVLVFRATIESSFLSDSGIAAVLEDEGQLLGSLDYQENLWWEYPDIPDVVVSLFATSQTLYDESPNAAVIAEKARNVRIRIPGVAGGDAEGGSEPTRLSMLADAIELLYQFMTLYPEDPLVDDAAFSLANAYLDIQNYETVVALSQRFGEQYDDSTYASSFKYMEALGHFWMRDYEPAIGSARVVATGDSEDRDFARYILGQIYHAEGQPAEAISWYERVAQMYPDAKDAIEYFTRKEVALDEVTRVLPGEQVTIPLRYRNVANAELQVYKVDLMKLYLREKNLSEITGINLAGISPLVVREISLGDGRDYVDKSRDIDLDLDAEGAYLVICRGDNLFASGLVLITPLKIEVQEDAASGRVRVNLVDERTGVRPANVHVKAIGSADGTFKSGETDLRGVFVADALRGEATAIAQSGDATYAFYRGETWLGAPNSARTEGQQTQGADKEMEAVDYTGNLYRQNEAVQSLNRSDWDRARRQGQDGVEIQKAQ